MGAPKRLILHVEATHASAFTLSEMPESEARHVVCRECAPNKSKMKRVAEVVVQDYSGPLHYYVYRCERCSRNWAAPFRVPVVESEGQ